MIKTKEVRTFLVSMLEGASGEATPQQAEAANGLLAILKRHDSRPFEEVLEMLAIAKPVRSQSPKLDLAVEVAFLRRVLLDDAKFLQAVRALQANRSVTKLFLMKLYSALFQRTGGLRASASREEIVQVILDERNVLRRHGTLEALTRVETVAAE